MAGDNCKMNGKYKNFADAYEHGALVAIRLMYESVTFFQLDIRAARVQCQEMVVRNAAELREIEQKSIQMKGRKK